MSQIEYDPTNGVLRVRPPYSDIDLSFPDGSDFANSLRILDIQRLRGIRQLGVMAILSSNSGGNGEFIELSGTRYDHSLTTAIYAQTIAKNIGLNEREIRLARDSGILHDRQMPAGGDATQRLDTDRLDEEKHWEENLPSEAKSYFTRHDITLREVDDAINGRGIIGEVLNHADRISYVLGDLQQLHRPPLRPDLGTIYRDVALNEDSGHLFFRDRKKLWWLLLERAWLFDQFYIDSQGQANDFVFASLMAPFYDPKQTQTDSLTPQRLRQMTDTDLIQYLSDRYGVDDKMFSTRNRWQPKYLQRPTLDEAMDVLDELQVDPALKVLGIKKRRGFDPSIDFNVWDDTSGEVVPAWDMYSIATAPYINNLVGKTSGFLVVYADASDQGPTSLITTPRII